MNLHRTTGKPDWASVKPAAYNLSQKVAAATGGMVTPGNLVTFIGLGLVLYGLAALINQEFLIGAIALAVGRALDVVDGWLAEVTSTKSPMGEMLDAASDKIGTLLAILAFFIAGITYWWLLTLLLLPHVVILVVVGYQRKRSVRIHPTRPGKLSMATAWFGLLGFIVLRATHESWPSVATVGVYGLVLVSVVLGLYAAWQYATGRD